MVTGLEGERVEKESKQGQWQAHLSSVCQLKMYRFHGFCSKEPTAN